MALDDGVLVWTGGYADFDLRVLCGEGGEGVAEESTEQRSIGLVGIARTRLREHSGGGICLRIAAEGRLTSCLLSYQPSRNSENQGACIVG